MIIIDFILFEDWSEDFYVANTSCELNLTMPLNLSQTYLLSISIVKMRSHGFNFLDMILFLRSVFDMI